MPCVVALRGTETSARLESMQDAKILRPAPRADADGKPRGRALLLTTLAMTAFAANSILCRWALKGDLIDGASFTAVRLVGGALALGAYHGLRSGSRRGTRLDLVAVVALFIYAGCFSFAYLDLSAATGTLILFGAVQLTMIGGGLLGGERPGRAVWLGVALAIGGFIFLMAPGVRAPSPLGASLMAAAGIAWGVYSLRGKTVADPVASTTWNFIGTVPLALALVALPALETSITPPGVLLALASGVAASGFGYVIWYATVPLLAPIRAATVQLSVPILVALAGVAMLAEPISARLLIAGVLTLGGIGLAIKGRVKRRG